MPPLKASARWFALAVLVVGLDQLSKYAVQQAFVFGESTSITSFFNLVLVFNPGAAFSFLSEASGWQRGFFVTVALAASAFVSFLIVKHRDKSLFCFALALILGGAVGNLIDRIVLGAVVDFLDFHVADYHWPAFNLADSSIFCGAAVLVWESFSDRSGHRRTAREAGDR